MYLPKQLLRKRKNTLILIELQKSADNNYITFSDSPNLMGHDTTKKSVIYMIIGVLLVFIFLKK